MIEAESTLSESTLKDLRDYQQELGLRDEVTLSENQTESDSLVGCKVEQLSDLYAKG